MDMQGISGWAEQGGQIVVTGAVDSTTDVQQSYPGATITVYLTGTATLATLFSNNNSSPTPLSNPFTASATGLWQFYAANGVYDIQFSGANIATPFTIGAVSLFDSTHNLAYSLGVQGTLAIASDQAQREYVIETVTPNLLRADVKTAPTGGPIDVSLYYTAATGSPTLVASFAISAGTYAATATTSVSVPAGNFWRVDITAVGTTTPGADLTITVQ
jgi:hypothetical protein